VGWWMMVADGGRLDLHWGMLRGDIRTIEDNFNCLHYGSLRWGFIVALLDIIELHCRHCFTDVDLCDVMIWITSLSCEIDCSDLIPDK